MNRGEDVISVSELLTVEEAAALLDMRPSSIYNAVADARIKAIRKGKRGILITRAEVERYRAAPKGAGGRRKKDEDQAQ